MGNILFNIIRVILIVSLIVLFYVNFFVWGYPKVTNYPEKIQYDWVGFIRHTGLIFFCPIGIALLIGIRYNKQLGLHFNK